MSEVKQENRFKRYFKETRAEVRPSLTVNLGTGRGYSVLDVVRAYALASGREIPCVMAPRRPGDVAACYADPTLAEQLLGWRALHGLERMCADSWRFQCMNPQGFDGPLHV